MKNNPIISVVKLHYLIPRNRGSYTILLLVVVKFHARCASRRAPVNFLNNLGIFIIFRKAQLNTDVRIIWVLEIDHS